MVKPRKDEQLVFRAPALLRREAELIAKRRKRSLSDVLRQLLAQGIWDDRHDRAMPELRFADEGGKET